MNQSNRDRKVESQRRQAVKDTIRSMNKTTSEGQRADSYKTVMHKGRVDNSRLRRQQHQEIILWTRRAHLARQKYQELMSDLERERADHTAIVAKLEQELEEKTRQAEASQAEAEEFKHGWRRERTDFENYRKHTENERDQVSRQASLAMLRELLPVLDDFDRALGSIPESMTDNPWLGGISIIQRKFQALLGKFEVETVDPTGELFDPNWHEAVGTVESETVTRGMVAETLQKGYRAGEILLRAALVKVAR